jgi:hypothetical protein
VSQVMQPNPTKVRAHYANMALQAATLAAIDALRAVVDCRYRNSSREFGRVCMDAFGALALYDAATVEWLEATFAEDSK